MKKFPCVLTIAGSDCSGGAGIQADIKTISALGAYAASAITAITVQNTIGVTDIYPIPAYYVKGQIEAVMTDIKPDAIKIGMINDSEIIKVIAECINKFKPQHIIFDPVMVSTSGRKLIEDKAIDCIKDILMPVTTIITPNLNETQVLTNDTISNTDDMKKAGKKLLELGCKSVLIKGGHLDGDDMCDVLTIKDDENCHIFKSAKINSKNTHGTGCTLSSAIATYLTLGHEITEAVRLAKKYVSKGISTSKDITIGAGHGPLNHLHSPVPMHIFSSNE